MSVMSFEALVPGSRGRELRVALLGAMRRAYTENVDRYDPDGIGDDATWFGLSVSRNLPHIVDALTRHLEGVEARRTSNTFFLQIDGAFELYFCKAPPNAPSVEAVGFDSHVRSRIVTRNGSHLQMRLDLVGGTTRALSDEAQAPYAVIVHFGGPESGFERAVVGAPYVLADSDLGWEWQEPFEETASEEGRSTVRALAPRPKPGAGEFGLVLRPAADVADEHS